MIFIVYENVFKNINAFINMTWYNFLRGDETVTVDDFFGTIAKVAGWILPVLGVVALIYLIMILKELLSTIKSATKTLDTTELQIRKLDAPLATVENLSHSIDNVSESASKAIKTASSAVTDNFDTIKTFVLDKSGDLLTKVQERSAGKSADRSKPVEVVKAAAEDIEE